MVAFVRAPPLQIRRERGPTRYPVKDISVAIGIGDGRQEAFAPSPPPKKSGKNSRANIM